VNNALIDMKTTIQFLKLISSIFFIAILTSCANMPKPLATPTGRPEVSIVKTNIADVKGVVSNIALDWGYYVKNISDYSAVYEKREEGVGMSVLFGSKYDSTPVWRLTFNFVPLNGDVRIVANIHLVTNAGSAFERITDLSKASKDANNIQQALERVKRNFAVRNVVAKGGKIGIRYEANLEISEVTQSGPAEKVGLKAGDRIVWAGHFFL
jgi:hypothetical protein